MQAHDTHNTMARESFGLNNILDELRDAHGEPVAETDNMVVFADTHGHELRDIADNTAGVNLGDVSQWMHEMARTLHDRDRLGGDAWSGADPVVVLKWNEGENPNLKGVDLK